MTSHVPPRRPNSFALPITDRAPPNISARKASCVKPIGKSCKVALVQVAEEHFSVGYFRRSQKAHQSSPSHKSLTRVLKEGLLGESEGFSRLV
jgi:hypothetical protein